jgi:glutathionylspermidine synthase
MDFSLNLFGIKASLVVEKELADNIGKVGEYLKTKYDDIVSEFTPDTSRESEDWSEDEYKEFISELQDGRTIIEISELHKRSINKITEKLENMLNVEIDNNTIKVIKEKYNNNDDVTRILRYIVTQL